ncbi:HD family phosphohydrolase [Anaeromyxobacter paludicola]|uniref:HD family phosphohydrolase n=1 Tax=Anaeromyxobacter paludicola TaxID=2918171 RepID=A0ABM7X8V0_9BACT|nr:HDIG domain-containing metalloprotein [Anaeromyxobacter paludicola]BDG08277.1 HD family phosphohydrolase [Anaeromyxobacter paludicola]
MSSPPPAEDGKRPAGADWTGRAWRALLLVLVAAAAGWFLTPGTGLSRLPGHDALGSLATATVRATRDYDLQDPEATARLRAEAAEDSRAVFDLDEGALESSAARVRAAFRLMRAAMAESPGRPGAIALAAARSLFEARLGAPVREADFQTLWSARFAEPLEREAVGLVARGLSGMVLADGERAVAGREQGIVVRSLRGGVSEGEHVISDLGLVRDLSQARADVERAGAALPRQEPAEVRAALLRLAADSVRPTLAYDHAETVARQRDAAARVKPVIVSVKRGERILGEGERIEPRHLVLLDGIRAQTRQLDLLRGRAGGAAVTALVALLLWAFGRAALPGFRPGGKDALLLATLLAGTVALTSGGFALAEALHDRFSGVAVTTLYELVPVAAGVLLVRAVLPAEAALLFAVAAAAVAGLGAGNSLYFEVKTLLGALAACILAPQVARRGALLRAGLAVGLVGALLAVGFRLLAGRTLAEAAPAAGAALLGGTLVLPAVVLVLAPALESVFGYVTDARLLELANLNHPALKELIVQAPGTYHHSVVMGALVESAAQAIGANPLLARVCAYYHDLGKIRNPLYFAENQRSENKHVGLAPTMSALILKRHVTDGLELVRQYKLPRVVADVIPQHHGTRLITYFWVRQQGLAREEAGKPDGARAGWEEESLFRYGGPRPQTREAALVMIADACEASARALAEPTPEALRGLVKKRIDEIFGDGQLDECSLTLKDLSLIAAAMVRGLEAVYHSRPEYPGKSGREPAQLSLVSGKVQP